MTQAISRHAGGVLRAFARLFGRRSTPPGPFGRPARRPPPPGGSAVVIEAGPGKGGRVLIGGCDASRYISAVNIDLTGAKPPSVVLEVPKAMVRVASESFHCDLSQMPRALARQLLKQLREAFPDD